MPLITYPGNLPPPSGYQFARREGRALPQGAGAESPRARMRDAIVDADTVRWRYSPAEMAIWRAWFADTLLNGQLWFTATLPGRGGWLPRVARYIGEQLQLTHLGAGFWEVSCRLELRGLSAAPATPDLLFHAWWEFEENDGTSAFVDSGPFDNDLLTSPSTDALSVSSGVEGRAHYRGGDAEALAERCVYAPRSNSALDFGPSSSFTIGAWINPQSLMATGWTRHIIGRSGIESDGPSVSLQDNSSYYLSALDGALNFVIVEPGVVTRLVSAGAIAANGSWQLFIGVCDVTAGEIRTSVNGAEGGSTSIEAGPQTGADANFSVGRMVRADTANDIVDDVQKRQFNGFVDKGFVVARALDPAECAWLYASGVGRSYADALARGIFQST